MNQTTTAPATDPDEERIDLIEHRMRAIADVHRLRLLAFLAHYGELSVRDLTRLLGGPKSSTVGLHLGKLYAANLVNRREDGVWTVYSCRPESFAEVAAALRTVYRRTLRRRSC